MNHEFITAAGIAKLSVMILTIALLAWAAAKVLELWIGLIGFLYVIGVAIA